MFVECALDDSGLSLTAHRNTQRALQSGFISWMLRSPCLRMFLISLDKVSCVQLCTAGFSVTGLSSTTNRAQNQGFFIHLEIIINNNNNSNNKIFGQIELTTISEY